MLRSPHDRPILRLALPALGALAAEPLYVLVDTAIVGHLGATQLAALALASAILSALYGLVTFLEYGTTSQVARADGAGRRDEADAVGVQGMWLAVLLGGTLALVAAAGATPLVAAMGAHGGAAHGAVTYLRIAALGLPFACVAVAGEGYLRGVASLRAPLLVLAAGNVANVVLELLFVYGFHWGLRGSAWGTTLAQAGMGALFLRLALRGRLRPPDRRRMVALLRVGVHLTVRTAAILATFVVGSSLVARTGTAPLAAHQIGFQLFFFLALVLDAIAIAGQVLVGRALGAGDAATAYDAAARMIVLATALGGLFALVLVAAEPWVAAAFTDDPGVRAQVRSIWLLFALMQPLAGAVFALDGILIGAGDSRYIMWAMVAAAAVFALVDVLVVAFGWGLRGVWIGLVAFVAARLATLLPRFRGRRWAVLGAAS
jgi:putative MATE family efflux protein